jgi:hypothetical protein
MSPARAAIEKLAVEIRRRGWVAMESELHHMCSQHGIGAVYDLGRRVGEWSMADALARAAADSWSPVTKPDPDDDDPPIEGEP